MDHDERFNKLIEDLYQSAKNYEQLLNKTVVFSNSEFKIQKTYNAKFYKDNFLHLTGVKTKIVAKDFFDRCLKKDLTLNDITNFKDEYRSRISGKLNNLLFINTFFNQELDVQESFAKNSVICAIASSDGIKTFGFVQAGKILLPMTILNRNRLDINKPIYRVKPKIINQKQKSPR